MKMVKRRIKKLPDFELKNNSNKITYVIGIFIIAVTLVLIAVDVTQENSKASVMLSPTTQPAAYGSPSPSPSPSPSGCEIDAKYSNGELVTYDDGDVKETLSSYVAYAGEINERAFLTEKSVFLNTHGCIDTDSNAGNNQFFFKGLIAFIDEDENAIRIDNDYCAEKNYMIPFANLFERICETCTINIKDEQGTTVETKVKTMAGVISPYKCNNGCVPYDQNGVSGACKK